MFSQLIDFFIRNDFNYLARKYGGDKYVKQFTCYNQLCVLMFGQLSNRESLRDVVLETQAHASRGYHLGFGKHAAKSSLTDANKKRDYRIFEVKTLLNRQNYPKKRLLSDKIAHSGISRDYYCKKFHF